MNRQNQILAAILAIQIVIGVVIFWPQAAASGESGPLLADFTAGEVVALTISDSEGQSITLAKNSDDEWALPNADDYPAQGEKVLDLLEIIDELQANRLVTQTEGSHTRLKVAEGEFERLVEMELARGDTYRLYIGTAGGGNALHVRANDQAQVYLVNGLDIWQVNAAASGWIDPVYFSLAPEEVTALTLENPNGTFELTREGESWNLAGLGQDETPAPEKLSALVNQATSIRMVEPIGREQQPAFGLDDPQAVLTLETAGESYTLRLGAQDEETENYVAASSESGYYVWVNAFTGNNFVQKTRQDFLQLPPTPEPEVGGSSD